MVHNFWHGDSHICGHIPKLFYELAQKNPLLHKFRQPVYVKPESGTMMDEKLMNQIMKKSKRFRGEAAVFIVQAGSNNLRCQGDKNKIAEDLISDYQKLKDYILTTTKHHALVVTSIIPDDREELKIIYEMVNNSLKKMFNHHPEDQDRRLHFVDFLEKCLPIQENGLRYDPKLYTDSLHLNLRGAELLAREVAAKMPSISNKAFGRKCLSRKTRMRRLELMKARPTPLAKNDALKKLSRYRDTQSGKQSDSLTKADRIGTATTKTSSKR